MKKIILSLIVLMQSIFCLATDNNAASGSSFTHPGAIISNEDIDNIRNHAYAQEEPWLTEWNALVNAYGKADYSASGNTEIGGSGGNRQRACRDALAAMYNAVIWRVRGSDENARCAAKILSAWGNKCVSAKDELFQFPCLDMCIAAECLRNADGSFYQGWAEADREKFMNMVRSVFVPALRGQTYNNLPSWSAPAMAGLMAAGILLDDAAIYNEALNDVMSTSGTKSGNIYKAIGTNGQVWEMGRDNVHAMLCVDDLVRMAQMAWNQGDDLWAAGDNRILKGIDYWCGYNIGHTGMPWSVVPSAENGAYRWFYVSQHDNAFRLRPDGSNYELAFHHYKEVVKMEEDHYPYLARFTKLARPEVNYHTLLYSRSLETSPLYTEKPHKPVGVNVVPCKGFNTISWNHPVGDDARDYTVLRSTNGSSWNEIYTGSYNTCNYIYDSNIEEGCTYYYKVRFRNYAGYSEMSDVCSCTVKAQSSSLPEGWNVASVSGKIPASATYSSASHGSFSLSGGGREIYYGDDGCGFLYYTMKGDGCITARIINCSGYQNGLMMRQSLDQGARMAALKLGGTGGRYLEMWNRVNPNDGKPTMLLGSDYTHFRSWMRLERKGNVFTSYVSNDGKVWEKVASQNLAMGTEEYYAGIFVCNDKNSSGGVRNINVDNVKVENGMQQKTKAPSAMRAEAVSCSRVDLTWDVAEGADSYTVTRYDDSSKESVVVAEGLTTTSFSDSHLSASTLYRYAVKSENMSGLSSDSASVEVSTLQLPLPSKPQMSVAQNTLNSVRVAWNEQDGADSYSLYRSTSLDGTMELIASNLHDTCYINDNLSNGTTYYYQVQATNSLGEAASDATPVEIKKYPRISNSFTVDDKGISVDFSSTLRGKCHFIILKPLTNSTWKLLGAQVQVANDKNFEDAVNIGTINYLSGLNISAGNATEPSEGYYRYLRIVPEYPGLTSADLGSLLCYGDTIRLRAQKIYFSDIPEKTIGDADFYAGATSMSELPVSYTSSDETVATVTTDGLIHIVGVGKCYITASQPGDNCIWAEARNVKKMLTVTAGADGIISISNDDEADTDATLYDLLGRKVSGSAPHGVYIYKGKKIVK